MLSRAAAYGSAPVIPPYNSLDHGQAPCKNDQPRSLF